MQTQLRYWEYYGLTNCFDELYEQAKAGNSFNRLYDKITSRENILLAYRTIKNNKGSKTAGTDGRTINDFKSMSEEQLVNLIQKRVANYQPMKVRRVYIPKANGDKRPLGIPSMSDRIIQQSIKQFLEPICEAQFFKHSYGFRPLRSTHDAIARMNRLINRSNLHYVVDIDIKGFFDNVNHSLLLKQLWNFGVQDRKILRIISKMLKAEIAGEGVPSKGTPQGGILSPLLSNIVLHDVDKWVSGQWECFETHHEYANISGKFKALKKTGLKEGYIVRYADDFKILCRDWKTAQKWYHAVELYINERLKLNISEEKSQIVNLRKRSSEFLGFTIRAVQKGNKRVVHSRLSKKKKEAYKAEGLKRIKQLQKIPTANNAMLFNSWVLGIHNYSKAATHVCKEFREIAYCLSRSLYNRFKQIGVYDYPNRPPPTYSRYYKTSIKAYKVNGVYLYPLADIKHQILRSFSQWQTPYTEKGRAGIHKNINIDVYQEIIKLMKSNISTRNIEYIDNRISRYSMRSGKCEITGRFLPAELVHCHHYLPVKLGGLDVFKNLRIIHKSLHVLIHATNKATIKKYIEEQKVGSGDLVKINIYRKMCNLESIS
ncbi:group II intron reverse transcriptase/maturase [Virgibacillus natechei]|uniref:Group II intron reverse transcriptase/maturase n=1 Tax=Virgibacillus natechei TaxID=1216297 RepID=A0ABS4IH70_9BACI|nr:group II intron reverse transcriptase/maturase [Virgibacillus natechei]MBP1970297.1 group II intron reverse transcriptase/maturase [Virgibacillus natechei]UZD13125.1 group II intron reverse transcriptase/maturase [Virgibacillus natechei]